MKLYRKSLRAALLAMVLCSPGWATLIGNDFNGNLYDVNLSTGVATNQRTTGISNLAGIAFNGAEVLYGMSVQAQSESLYRINPTTGASTLIGSSAVLNPFTDEFGEGDLRFNPVTGSLFGVEYLSVPQSTPAPMGLTINPATGAILNFFNLPCFNNSCVVDYSAMTISANGQLYVLDTQSIDPYGHLIVANSSPFSVLSNVRLSAPLGNVAGMDFDPVSGTLYVADGGTGGGNLYTLNPTTGALSLVGGLALSNGLAGLAFSPTSVPEPGSLLLLALSALGAFAWRCFRRSPKVDNFREKLGWG